MGHGKDMVSNGKKLEDMYSENAYGTSKFLANWREGYEREYYSTDWDKIDLYIDYEYALKSKTLTGKERVVLTLVYSLGLNNIQASDFADIDIIEVNECLKKGVIKITKIIQDGFDKDNLHTWEKSKALTLEEFLKEAYEGNINIFKVNDYVNNDVLKKLAAIGDTNAQYALGMIEAESPEKGIEHWENESDASKEVLTDVQLDKYLTRHCASPSTIEDSVFLDLADFKNTKYYFKRKNTKTKNISVGGF